MFWPAMSSDAELLFTSALSGLKELMTVPMVNGSALERMPAGSAIAIWAVPAELSKAAGRVAAICACWIRVGEIRTTVPFGAVQEIVDPWANVEPAIVTGVFPAPADTWLGV